MRKKKEGLARDACKQGSHATRFPWDPGNPGWCNAKEPRSRGATWMDEPG